MSLTTRTITRTIRVERIYVTLKRTPLEVAKRRKRHIQRYLSAWAKSKGWLAGSIEVFEECPSDMFIRGVSRVRAYAYAIPMGSHGFTRERLDKSLDMGVRAIRYNEVPDAQTINH